MAYGKKYTSALQKVDRTQVHTIAEGIDKVKEASFANFDESVDVSVNLGIDPTKGDQVVRGSVLLPHGRGKKVRVIVFAKGEHVDKAVTAGADEVGLEDLIEKVQKGWLDFDYAVATPDVMGTVGQLAKILGPRGLLPNKKTGTVTFDVATAVENLKKGQAFFKNDKGGLVHFSLGKRSFDTDKLVDNYTAFIKSLIAAKPASSKGKYLKKITVTTTMGPGVPVSPEQATKL